jgi:hypothetical protein
MSEEASTFLSIEDLWQALLSRQAAQVQAAFGTLDSEQQSAVIAHLRRMTQEPGWHPEQRISAQAALEALAG